MRSFAALATFATVAFAAVASALPTLPGATNGVTHPALPREVEVPKGGDVHVPNVHNVKRSATSPLALAIPKPHHVPRGGEYQEQHSVAKIIVDLTAQVQPLCDELTTSISGDVEVSAAVDVSLHILGEIKEHLVTAKADIQAAISVGVDLLVVDGQTLAVSAVAEIIATLVIAITTVLSLVIRVCASARVDILIKLCADIGVELAAIISLVVQICANLIIVLKPLIAAAVQIIVNLDLKALIQVLALNGGAHY